MCEYSLDTQKEDVCNVNVNVNVNDMTFLSDACKLMK